MAAIKTQTTSLAPLLSVKGGARALEFYEAAFGAKEVFRIEDPEGLVVARLAIDGAEFWVADDSPGDANLSGANFSPEALGGSCVRMVLTVNDPDAVFAKAIAGGATEVYAVSDQPYGWRLGRLVDPFGHHWEIGKPLCDSLK